MDAARLTGIRQWPPEFLGQAAIGYLTSEHRTRPPSTWRAPAFAYAQQKLRGAVSALTPIPPGDGTGVAAWQLADALEQYSRQHRAGTIPPSAFWAAAAEYAPAGTLETFAGAAEERGLFRIAAQLLKNATPVSASAASKLVRSLWYHHPADMRPGDWVAAHADIGDAYGVAWLLKELRKAGTREQVAALLRRDPAAHADLSNPRGVAWLLKELRKAGTREQVAALLRRDPAAHADPSDPGMTLLLEELRDTGVIDDIYQFDPEDNGKPEKAWGWDDLV